MKVFYAYSNRFSGTIDLGHLPGNLTHLWVGENNLSGTVRVPAGCTCMLDGNEELIVEHI